MSSQFGFTRRELRTLRALRTPLGVQRALDAMPYHLADTAWSPRRVLGTRTAHCLEGAIFSAAGPPGPRLPPPLPGPPAPQGTPHRPPGVPLRGRWGAVAQFELSGPPYPA